ncbi:uncharacterized protein B0T23DRAFT_390060 [Neurospora hispaniola]|uniref:Uncharacterized protein n=1 Tax=Neurospora hispaniola TaxID=588809 RepID=A0AAJ0HYI5_9PEZI|nr:hypothetical protein B0T23DRAFT_390060 [Neurospora hispaniola]
MTKPHSSSFVLVRSFIPYQPRTAGLITTIIACIVSLSAEWLGCASHTYQSSRARLLTRCHNKNTHSQLTVYYSCSNQRTNEHEPPNQLITNREKYR